MTLPELHKQFLINQVICTDTRKIIPGAIFFALKGDNFNGNKFASMAIEQGCDLAIVDEKEYVTNTKIILVDDVLVCLQNLANFHRKYWGKKIIALTGSNGKTTTKELINNVLKQKMNCLATIGNLNNHIGVPLTLLSLKHEHDIAIVEMGANHQGEIAQLCKIAEPDFGVITNIGKAHLEGFGGEAGVLKGKGEMYNYIRDYKGQIFINGDDEKLNSISKGINAISYGYGVNNTIQGDIMDEGILLSMKVQYQSNTITIASNLTGKYNGINILCACAIGIQAGLSLAEIKMGIETYFPDNNRSQIKKTNHNTLILDAYNANPSSMLLAIENLAQIEAAHKFFILGDMLEMGEYANEEHLAILKRLKELNLSGVLVGQHFMKYKDDFQFTFFMNAIEAKVYLAKKNIIDSVILIKGSRGIKLESVVDLF